jgi:hypothetical protein
MAAMIGHKHRSDEQAIAPRVLPPIDAYRYDATFILFKPNCACRLPAASAQRAAT